MSLMHNPIADMYGPHFLLLYGSVILVTLAACWWTLRASDSTASLSLPHVPSEPDPYEIAYLRGGENEVTRTTIFGLIQRGYLQVTEEPKKWWQGSAVQRIGLAPNPPDTRHLSQVEHFVFNAMQTPYTAREIFQSTMLTASVKDYCNLFYKPRLQSEQLLVPPGVQNTAWQIGLVGGTLIIGLGLYKLLVALAKGRTNVGFLIIMGVLAILGLIGICSPRLSARGQTYVQRLRLAFEGLKERAHIPLTSPSILLLLVGLFGVNALTGTPYDYYREMFRKAASSGGACGGGCGSCGGGGCGGGCGGCGGG